MYRFTLSLHPESELGTVWMIGFDAVQCLQNATMLFLGDGLGFCQIAVGANNPWLIALEQ